MILPIGDSHRIKSDPFQWIVQRRLPRTDPSRQWEAIGYFSTYEAAAGFLGERLVREGEAEGWAEALAHVRSVATTLARALPDLRVQLRRVEEHKEGDPE
jgi:hypothetical protein